VAKRQRVLHAQFQWQHHGLHCYLRPPQATPGDDHSLCYLYSIKPFSVQLQRINYQRLSSSNSFMSNYAETSNNYKGSVERIPPPPILTFDLPICNHLVPCSHGYDWPSSVTIGLEMVPGSCSQTYLYIHTYIYKPTYLPIYISTDAGENITSHHLWWET